MCRCCSVVALVAQVHVDCTVFVKLVLVEETCLALFVVKTQVGNVVLPIVLSTEEVIGVWICHVGPDIDRVGIVVRVLLRMFVYLEPEVVLCFQSDVFVSVDVELCVVCVDVMVGGRGRRNIERNLGGR